MFAFIEGLLDYIGEESCVIDAGGFGINVSVSSKTIQSLPDIGEHVKLYTYTSVREDAISLYGFTERNELDFFKKLICVSGVGPKIALGILSAFDVEALRIAITMEDAKTISKAPGIGLKTAQKIVLELKDKISVSDDELIGGLTGSKNSENRILKEDKSLTSEMQDAIAGLQTLGYSITDARRAVLSLTDINELDSGKIMSLALKELYK